MPRVGLREQVLDHDDAAGGVDDLGDSRNRHDVGDDAVLQVVAQPGVLAELLVCGGEGHVGGDRSVEHADDLLRPHRELQFGRDRGLGAPLGVAGHPAR